LAVIAVLECGAPPNSVATAMGCDEIGAVIGGIVYEKRTG